VGTVSFVDTKELEHKVLEIEMERTGSGGNKTMKKKKKNTSKNLHTLIQ
jgi:hypothetical protein